MCRIENFEPVPVPKETYGMFFGGDSYLLKYTYQKFNRDHYVIYFWQVNIHNSYTNMVNYVLISAQFCAVVYDQVRVTTRH